MSYDLNHLLNQYNLKAKKHLGQNWLIDQNIIKKIVEILNPTNQEIIEVGPGLGALTFLLTQVAKQVRAYEVDSKAIEVLNHELAVNNLEIIHQDFLTAQFDWTAPKSLIGNIPYYITSDIIFKILKNQAKFSRIVLTVQLEVADRMVATIGSANYSKLTVSLNALAKVKKHFVINRACFFPVPKVDSAVVSFELNHRLDQETSERFLTFIKQCFAFRRKTLLNNLLVLIQNKTIIEDSLTSLNLHLKVRPQELGHEKFFDLFQKLEAFLK